MKTAIKLGIPILLAVLIVVYGLISYMIASGVTKAERKPQEDHPAAYGLEFEEVQFVSRKGDMVLSGWYLPSQTAKPTLIFVHGNGSVRSGDNSVDLASRLVEQGFSVLLFDLLGHGSSGGDQVSGGNYERWDVLGAFDFLVGRGTPPKGIGLVGFSMGAAASILAAAEEPGIRALVADSPYANASEMIAHEAARQTIFPEWITPIFVPTAKLMASQLYDINIGALDPEDAVRRLPYPILVIHGMADMRIPVDRGVRVHQAAHPESSIWLVPGADHVDAFLTHPDEYVQRVVDYLESRFSAQ